MTTLSAAPLNHRQTTRTGLKILTRAFWELVPIGVYFAKKEQWRNWKILLVDDTETALQDDDIAYSSDGLIKT